jgi:TatD DNase family protein
MLVAHGVERAIVHWYSGPLDVLKRMVAAGYLFTVGVEVLHSAHLRDVAQAIPADQLLTETDNPGGYRWLTGDTGYPAHLGDVVGELARLRAVHPDDLATTVRRNLIRLLEGDPHLASWLAELV